MSYFKVSSYEGQKGEIKKAMLLFSGGLDSSVVLKWLQESYGCEVVTLTVNLGQLKTAGENDNIKQKALKLGASDAIVLDVADEFTEGYISKGIMANGAYRGKYYLSTPLGRPLIAKLAAQFAPDFGCDAVAHGCTGKGNDQVRLDAGVLACNPSLKIIAPVREWNMDRKSELEYAEKNGINVTATVSSLYSHDENIWGNTSEGAEIEFPSKTPDFKKALKWCVTPEEAPDAPQYLTLSFKKGIPSSLNGKNMSLVNIIAALNETGGKHGVGVATVIEDRILGMKSRGVYESPAAEIIMTAHAELEKLVLTHDQLQFKAHVDRQWSWMCYHAKWYDPLMEDLNAYLKKANENLDGTVKIKLYKGTATAVETDSQNSLFNISAASFDSTDTGEFNTNASAPFIEHYSAWQWTAAKVNMKGLK